MLTAAAAKRHISLCGCVHHFILVVSLFDRQYRFKKEGFPMKFDLNCSCLDGLVLIDRGFIKELNSELNYDLLCSF